MNIDRISLVLFTDGWVEARGPMTVVCPVTVYATAHREQGRASPRAAGPKPYRVSNGVERTIPLATADCIAVNLPSILSPYPPSHAPVALYSRL